MEDPNKVPNAGVISPTPPITTDPTISGGSTPSGALGSASEPVPEAPVNETVPPEIQTELAERRTNVKRFDVSASIPLLYLPTEADINTASNQHGTHTLGVPALFITTNVNEDWTVNGLAILDGALVWLKSVTVADRDDEHKPGTLIAHGR